jgi:membrane-associated phospholipid phosphatase
MALSGAAAGLVLLLLTWFLTHHARLIERADASILSGFIQLNRPGLNQLTNFVAGLCDPNRYVFLAAVPVLIALGRRRPRVAALIALIIVGANETTQLLKPALAGPHIYLRGGPTTAASWPSGHATAAMSLALCMVMAAPARLRPAVGAAMAAFAVAVSYSFLELGWHYPSDVLGGFLVAATWTLAGVAGLSTYEARRSRDPVHSDRIRAGQPSLLDVLRPVAGVLAVAVVGLALIALARPHAVIAYTSAHKPFVLGAGAIGLTGMMLASGLTLMLRRG